MGHPIQYGPHASHLWENQSAFQVLFHYLQICDIIFFSINKKIIPGLVALYNEIKVNGLTPSYHFIHVSNWRQFELTKYLRNVS